ncbi:HIT-like domain protein [Acididesulfobacillus acetoxydans]|uniref:Galactose-1-phosphate uridylyltransferase-like protein n=1 Tax=Acididesulfobacillus acetoxydans TaxID=1561005 RepID=A0A8S0X3Z2_9FIRM|nr:hypothetical protein [Acididesulfobacillus acetoxydans]CAA7600450.1 HIT-like domain protein [Acididesulfobacillus acetoxydans]CEJ06584.1 Galactose-1-phosphate uridylyltransferase-like protein [Acididesulfobacillus acetoxydans]
MSLAFQRETRQSVFRDPRRDFQTSKAEFEIRFDPITEELTRIFPLHNFRLQRRDWAPLATLTQEKGCPFCPDALKKATPLFPEAMIPTGRLTHGGATVIPNLSPYAPYSGVVIMCREHYLPLAQFPAGVMEDGFSAALAFLEQAQAYDSANARYSTIGWNYMPFAGGSVIHPHLQALAGPEPSNRHKLSMERSHSYYLETGNNAWENLIDQEKVKGDRYLWQEGSLHWLASFAPRGLGDLTLVFEGKSTLRDLAPEDIHYLARGLQRVFRFYDSLNLPSFNLALFPAPEKQPGYWLNARLTGRFTVFDWTSDINSLQLLLGDFYSFLPPENIRAKI